MNIIESISSVFSNYTNFSGRACRSEFWWWALSNFTIGVVLSLLTFSSSPSLALIVYYLATFIPTLAVTVRRHHDSDRSGWWILIGIIPLIGPLILIFWYASKGDDGPNRFGNDPLGPDNSLL